MNDAATPAGAIARVEARLRRTTMLGRATIASPIATGFATTLATMLFGDEVGRAAVVVGTFAMMSLGAVAGIALASGSGAR